MIKKTKDAYSITKKTNSRTSNTSQRKQLNRPFGRRHASVKVRMDAINRKRVHQGLEPLGGH